MKRLSVSPYGCGLGDYYNHAMALLEISPQSIDVSYYEYPSWNDQFTPPRVDDPILMFKETILPR